MKKLYISILLLSCTSLFANAAFVKNKQYTCINTHSIKQGQQYPANKEEAQKRPFVFSLINEKLITTDNVSFDFKMARGPMMSYSNQHYMLLLMPNLQVGLVPKEAQGAVQFYFECK